MSLGKVLELVDPLESMTARSLDEEQHRACLTRSSVDDAEAHIRPVLDSDSNSIVVECAHRQGYSQLVPTIIRELGGICKRQSQRPGVGCFIFLRSVFKIICHPEPEQDRSAVEVLRRRGISPIVPRRCLTSPCSTVFRGAPVGMT